MPAGVTRIRQSVSAAQRRRPLAAAITTIETAHSAPTRTPYKNVKCSANWMWEAKLEGEGAAMWDACEGMCDMMRRRRHAAAAASQGVRCCGGGDGGDASEASEPYLNEVRLLPRHHLLVRHPKRQ